MLGVFSGNIRRAGISKGKMAVIAVIVFMTLTFFAMGYTAVESVENSAGATQQQNAGEGENAAISVFKFV